MANYKRKRARTASSGYYSANGLKHRLGEAHGAWMWLSNWPRNFDKHYHTRPTRRATRKLERAILSGEDPDGICWPDGRKPHIYYW